MPLTGPAAARLFDDHVDAVHAMIVRRVGTSDGVRITEEVFEQAASSWDRFDPDEGTERNFLFGVATVVIRRHNDLERSHLLSLRPPLRRSGSISDPLVSVHTSDDGASTNGARRDSHDETVDDEVAVTMRRVAALDPDDRDILLLSTWEGCQNAAVADALDLSVGAVRSRLGKIRRELKAAVTADRRRRAAEADDDADTDDDADAHDPSGETERASR